MHHHALSSKFHGSNGQQQSDHNYIVKTELHFEPITRCKLGHHASVSFSSVNDSSNIGFCALCELLTKIFNPSKKYTFTEATSDEVHGELPVGCFSVPVLSLLSVLLLGSPEAS